LPGVFREALLSAGEIREAVLKRPDLTRARRIWMINSLREWVSCVLLEPSGIGS
jgi:branched-subunit amino acid aminotransferase/4-amino-4-deoxychorismate lyase